MLLLATLSATQNEGGETLGLAAARMLRSLTLDDPMLRSPKPAERLAQLLAVTKRMTDEASKHAIAEAATHSYTS